MVTSRVPAAAGGSASFTRCFSSYRRVLRRAGAPTVDRDGRVPVVLPAGTPSNRVVTGSTRTGSGEVGRGELPALDEHQPVAGHVAHHGLDAVGTLRRLLQEGHALRRGTN